MNLPRLLRTVRHLRFSQIWHRAYLRAKFFRIGHPVGHHRRNQSGQWVTPVARTATITGPRRFVFFGQAMPVDSWTDWNNRDRDKLLLYHLHYMDDLNAASAADRREWHRDLIARWIDENPVLIGNGWEPYPLSLRIVNWIKWMLAGNELSEPQLQSLWLQARVLRQSIEYHLLANHLMANAKALFLAGAFFAEGEAEDWLAKGAELLAAEIVEQVLPDGGHFERSPMYQSTILEDFLDIVNISRAFGVRYPSSLDGKIPDMLSWLRAMTHPDGTPAHFNDSVSGAAPAFSELRDYASRLGFGDRERPSSAGPVSYLEHSGYVRYASGDAVVIVDVGEIGPDYQPGHAHNDCLSFELSIGGRKTIVNTGVSTYNVEERRNRERATNAHNTVSIEAADQSETWSAFRVGRRARPVDIKLDGQRLRAGHDGWQHLGLLHHRSIDFNAGALHVRDEFTGDANGTRPGTAHFHFHPSIDIRQHADRIDFEQGSLSFQNHLSIHIDDFEYCHGFYHRETAKVVRVTFSDSLETTITYANSVPD